MTSRYIALYVPETFLPIWEKFKLIAKREGLTVSALFRRIIENYVRLHDPGNPQRPITAFVMGHPDSYKAQHQSRLKALVQKAMRMGELRWRDVLAICHDVDKRLRVGEAEKLYQELTKMGIKVWR